MANQRKGKKNQSNHNGQSKKRKNHNEPIKKSSKNKAPAFSAGKHGDHVVISSSFSLPLWLMGWVAAIFGASERPHCMQQN